VVECEESARPVAGLAADRIRCAVVEVLESDGYDALQVREVARRARVSLAKIYKLYGTRDELICAGLQAWMDEARYAGLDQAAHVGAESLYPALMRVLRGIFEPWEDHPGLLVSYLRARSAPGGEKLIRRGFDAVVPAAMAVLADVDPEFVRDLDSILSSLVYGLIARVACGEIDVSVIVPTIDRAVFRLVTGYEASRPRRPEEE